MSSYRSDAKGPLAQWLVSSYDQTLSTKMTNETLVILARTHLDSLTEEGWAAAGSVIAGILASGDIHHLCLLDPDIWDLAPADFYHVTQILAFFKKRVDLECGIDRKAVALETFRASEASCLLTNRRFRAWSSGNFKFSRYTESILHASQRKISKVLGDAPSYAQIRPRFGPGASTSTPKRNACLAVKLDASPACSTNFAHRLNETMPTIFCGYGVAEEFVDVEIHAARLSFVPKNAKTDRGIVTEPSLNGMFQLGIGDHIARLLKSRANQDIQDQSRNQIWARNGSLYGSIATIDLSAASDTISTGLVEHLFSHEWFQLFMETRSAEVSVEGKLLYQQKISSMGNGFTFPLETLIFWALASSVAEIESPHRSAVSVYGDDIAVPTPAAAPLMNVLVELGFTPNSSKSFISGPFRESCGKDYLKGIDVRPVFVKDRLTGADFFRLHNFYVSRGDFYRAEIMKSWIHPSCRLHGPQGYGDGHLHGPYIGVRAGVKKGWSGYTFTTWSHSPKTLKTGIIRSLRREVKGRRKFVYSGEPRFSVLVRKIATYLSYQAESGGTSEDPLASHVIKRLYDEQPDDPLYGKAVADVSRLINPSPPGDRVAVVPGKGQLCRTKIYIFEPTYLT